MKKITFLSLLMFLMMAIPMMTSCSKDDGGGTNGKNGGGNTNPNPPVADIHVVDHTGCLLWKNRSELRFLVILYRKPRMVSIQICCQTI